MIETDKIIFAELASMLVAGDSLNAEQEELLSSLLEKYPAGKAYLQHIVEKGAIETPVDLRNIDSDNEWERFQTAVSKEVKPSAVFQSYWKMYTSVAAALVAVLLLGLWWYTSSEQLSYIVEDKVYGQKNDVLPNDEQAIFEVDGKLFQRLGRKELGQRPSTPDAGNRRHKIITPTRSSYSIVLLDGTKVWLSPESEVEYSAAFSSAERRIRLKGEAFFEVAKDTERPFIVEVDGLQVRALGTAFSVNNYDNKEPQVLLTEGRLQLTAEHGEAVIEAGYQADVIEGKLHAGVSSHLEDALGIKDGFFNFNNKDIETILEEVKRWYGVDLDVERKLEQKRYSGSIERNVTLGRVCAVLKDLTGYQYLIDGNKLIVR